MPRFTFWVCPICKARIYVGRVREHLDWHRREGVPETTVQVVRDKAAREWRR